MKAEAVLWVALAALVLGLLAIGLYGLTPWGCEARWERDVRWAITTGCLVDVDGEFVPEQNVREI